MLKLLIFDFDGVIVDTEPLHFESFRRVLEIQGFTLKENDYYEKYLALDDRSFFLISFKDGGKILNEEELSNLLNIKSKMFIDLISRVEVNTMPGVKELIDSVFGEYPLSIGSGALRNEIDLILNKCGLIDRFDVVVSSDDVKKCKPDPEVYLHVLSQFNKTHGIKADECVVIEDSVDGIRAGKNAGMKVIAVSNSNPADKLTYADLVIDSLSNIGVNELKELFN